MAEATRAEPGVTRVRRTQRRLDFLDSVRACAALYVVLHHIWVTTYPDAAHPGPGYLQWLAFGYLAVSVFIVVSGFSLSIGPARHGWRLRGGALTFFYRRAWRILPTYWAALILSSLVYGLVTPAQTGANVSAKGTVVHALLLQDLVDSPKPNGAFWSIAIEWQIYFVFPLVLVLFRRWGAVVLLAVVVPAVVAADALARTGGVFAHLANLSPEFLALFTFGVVASRVLAVTPSAATRRVFVGVGGVGWGAFLLLAALVGATWVETHYFWVTLLVGAATAAWLASLVEGRPRMLSSLLATRPLGSTGRFSYSLYCVHLPLLWLTWRFVVTPIGASTEASFWMLLALGLPVALVGAYAFSRVFERPFLTRRSWRAWREVLRPST